MEFFIVGQLLFNGLVVYALFIWWSERKRVSSILDEDRLNQCLNSLDLHSSQLNQEELRYRQRMEEGLRLLNHVCEQAKAILRKGQVQSGPPTLEEDELKAVLAKENPGATDRTSVPPSATNEPAKPSFRPEISLDLRSLLRDQLT